MDKSNNDNLKILRLSNDLYPDFIGGIALHVHYLSKYMYDLGQHTTILAPARKGYRKNKELAYNVIYHKIVLEPFGNCFSPSMLFTIYKNKHNFDLIHAHSHLFFPTIIAAFIRRFLTDTPLIITNHGIMSTSAPDWFNELYMKTIGKWTLNSADRIICYTEKEMDWFVGKLKINGAKIIVIPNGVDTKLFCPKVDRSKRTNTILWNGRFVSGKRVDFLLIAVKKVITTFPNLRVLLVGEGPLKGEIEKLVNALNLENIVTIKNFVPYEEMPTLYRNSDIFVLPSLHEGVPRSILEAMSCGIPVIITEFDHLRGLIERSGLMFQKDDVDELSRCITRLINDRTLALKMGNNGRDKITSQYSWQNTVLQTLKLYKNIKKAQAGTR